MSYPIMRHVWDWINSTLDQCRFTAATWQKTKWRLKYLLNRPAHVPTFENLVSHPHRDVLCRYVLNLKGASSILEVGCGKGANLFCLNALSRSLKLFGTDIDQHIISTARSELASRGLTDIGLSLGSATDLTAFGDRSVDVVLLDAVSMYLPPAKIAVALREALRVSRSAVVLSAWHRTVHEEKEPWHYDDGTWVYDYKRLVAESSLRGRVDVTHYEDGAWADARWQKFGVIVAIRRD